MRKDFFHRKKLPVLRPAFRILLYLVTVFLSILSLLEAAGGGPVAAEDIVIYVLAACGLAFSCYYLYYDLTAGFREILQKALGKSRLAERLYNDYRYRTLAGTLFALLLNLVYAVSNGAYAVWSRSLWLGTLSAYYIFMSILRFTVIWQEYRTTERRGREPAGKEDRDRWKTEWTVFGRAGILLVLITLVLGGSVIFLLQEEGGKTYPGYLIFAAAAYTFYKVIVSIINMVKVSRMRSPMLLTARNIGYADALVSVLFLQTAMFAAFGEGREINIQLMNELTGGTVCIMIFLIGVYMIKKAVQEKRKMEKKW